MKLNISCTVQTLLASLLVTFTAHGASIYWASSTSDMIHRVNTDGTGLTDITPDLQQAPYGTSGGPWGVASANGKIYFTQDNDSKLHSVEHDGSGLTELGSGTSIGNARDIHGANNNLYWLTWSGEIKSSNFSGGSISNVHTTSGFLQGIFVNSQYIYYTNSTSKTVSRVDINGSNPTNLVTGQNIPYGIWATSSNLYWVDLGNGTLSRSNLDGSSVTTLSNTLTRPSGITIYENHIYITEQHGDLLRLNMDGTNRTTILSGMSDARFLEIVQIPEPSSSTLLGLGMMGLLWNRNKKRPATPSR